MLVTKYSSCRGDNSCPLELFGACLQEAFKPIMMLHAYGSIDKRGQMFEISSVDVMLLICSGVIQLLILNPVLRQLACVCVWTPDICVCVCVCMCARHSCSRLRIRH